MREFRSLPSLLHAFLKMFLVPSETYESVLLAHHRRWLTLPCNCNLFQSRKGWYTTATACVPDETMQSIASHPPPLLPSQLVTRHLGHINSFRITTWAINSIDGRLWTSSWWERSTAYLFHFCLQNPVWAIAHGLRKSAGKQLSLPLPGWIRPVTISSKWDSGY